MINMKKVLILVFVMLLVSGCGNKEENKVEVLKDEDVYVNEINSIPGSLSFYLWEPIGKKYSKLLENFDYEADKPTYVQFFDKTLNAYIDYDFLKNKEFKGSVKNLTDGFLFFSQNISFCPI